MSKLTGMPVGAPLQTMGQRVNTFLSKLSAPKPGTGCIEWTGIVDKDGYGNFWYNRKMIKAHRFAFIAYGNYLPDEMLVMHSCDNPKCCSPYHLRAGTTQHNVADRVARGRTKVGFGESKSKLTEADVLAIRNSNLKQKDLAYIYELTQGAISAIQLGRTWKHLPN